MSSDVHVRQAAPGDEAALALVGAATFLDAFAGMLDGGDILAHCRRQHAPDVYAQWLAEKSHAIWLATIEPGEAPIGYLVLAPAHLPLADLAPDDLDVKRIYVLSRFQRAGLGRALMQLAKDEARRRHARRLLLGVYSKNDRAIAFYRREGFATVGARTFQVGQRQYQDLILSAPLSADPTASKS
jgi:diamine N-acetyltransferase